MNQTENAQMIALMEHAVENLREHTQETLQDCEQILEYDQQMAEYLHAADDALYQVKKSERGKICLTVYSDIV